MQKRASGEGGFTLIELLIVIVILGILAAVVVFAVGGVTNTGEDAACKADKKTLETAIEAYRAQEGSYPANEAALVPGFLHSASDNYDIGPGNQAVAQASGDCT
jgi:type II secretion system protein G